MPQLKNCRTRTPGPGTRDLRVRPKLQRDRGPIHERPVEHGHLSVRLPVMSENRAHETGSPTIWKRPAGCRPPTAASTTTMGMRFPRRLEAAKAQLFELAGKLVRRAQASGRLRPISPLKDLAFLNCANARILPGGPRRRRPRRLAAAPRPLSGRLSRRAGPPAAPAAAVTPAGPPRHAHLGCRSASHAHQHAATASSTGCPACARVTPRRTLGDP
jgi:hypothetical protein